MSVCLPTLGSSKDILFSENREVLFLRDRPLFFQGVGGLYDFLWHESLFVFIIFGWAIALCNNYFKVKNMAWRV